MRNIHHKIIVAVTAGLVSLTALGQLTERVYQTEVPDVAAEAGYTEVVTSDDSQYPADTSGMTESNYDPAADQPPSQPSGQYYYPQGDPMMAAIQAIQQAPDPSTVVDAYSNGLLVERDNPALHYAFVQRMVDFGMPELAYTQALTLISLDPGNGTAWAVIAYMDAKSGQMPGALSASVLAIRRQPNDPFVQQAAGQVFAWYDTFEVPPTVSASLRVDVAKARQVITGQPAFDQSYQETRAAYDAQARNPQPVTPDLAPMPVADDSGWQNDSGWQPAYEPSPAPFYEPVPMYQPVPVYEPAPYAVWTGGFVTFGPPVLIVNDPMCLARVAYVHPRCDDFIIAQPMRDDVFIGHRRHRDVDINISFNFFAHVDRDDFARVHRNHGRGEVVRVVHDDAGRPAVIGRPVGRNDSTDARNRVVTVRAIDKYRNVTPSHVMTAGSVRRVALTTDDKPVATVRSLAQVNAAPSRPVAAKVLRPSARTVDAGASSPSRQVRPAPAVSVTPADGANAEVIPPARPSVRPATMVRPADATRTGAAVDAPKPGNTPLRPVRPSATAVNPRVLDNPGRDTKDATIRPVSPINPSRSVAPSTPARTTTPTRPPVVTRESVRPGASSNVDQAQPLSPRQTNTSAAPKPTTPDRLAPRVTRDPAPSAPPTPTPRAAVAPAPRPTPAPAPRINTAPPAATPAPRPAPVLERPTPPAPAPDRPTVKPSADTTPAPASRPSRPQERRN